MIGPGTGAVQPNVRMPVAQRGATLALALIGKRQVVMGIGVAGRQENGPAVGLDGLFGPVEFVEHVAKVEEGEHVSRVGDGGSAIEFFSAAEAAHVKVNRSQIDVGGSKARVGGNDLVI